MYVTMAEMVVIVDTLRASGNIADGGHLFGYTKATRSTLHNTLIDRLKTVSIGVKEDDDAEDNGNVTS